MPQLKATMEQLTAKEFLAQHQIPQAYINKGEVIHLPEEGVYLSTYVKLENNRYTFSYTTEITQAGVYPPADAKKIIDALKRRSVKANSISASSMFEPDGSEN